MSLEELDHHLFVLNRMAHRFDSPGYWDVTDVPGGSLHLNYSGHIAEIDRIQVELEREFSAVERTGWKQDSKQIATISIGTTSPRPTLIFSALDRYCTIMSASLLGDRLSLVEKLLSRNRYQLFPFDDLQAVVPVHIEGLQHELFHEQTKTYFDAAFNLG
ncbi:MAG: hypothetical protein V4640_02505 [Verrucomicrobiota bacterium]